jgi:hypothetical protein
MQGKMTTETRKSGVLGRFSGATTSTTSFDATGLLDTSKGITAVTDALKDLKATVQGMSAAFSAGPVVAMLTAIRREAETTSRSITALSKAVGTVGGGGGASPSKPMGIGAGSGASAAPATQSPSAAVAQAAAGVSQVSGFGAALGTGINSAVTGIASSLPYGAAIVSAAEMSGAVAMAPLRYMRNTIQNNRVSALSMSQELSPYGWALGRGTNSLMTDLGNGMPGGAKGSVGDMLAAMNIGRQTGAMYGFQGDAAGTSGRYATGYYTSLSQMQQMTPGVGLGKIAATLGGQISNTQSQQAAAFYTGGAFSLVKTGGKGMKSTVEWAEGILKWLQNQRPGSDRGKAFTYGELLAQNFPGSNINAWFDMVGVTPDMRDYWWTYAMGRTQGGNQGADASKLFKDMSGGANQQSNLAVRRMASQSMLATNDFTLAGAMSNAYSNREASNQVFNKLLGKMNLSTILAASNAGSLGFLQNTSDVVENFLWDILNNAGGLVQTGAGAGLMANMFPSALGSGDPGVGDPGGYGAMGGTTASTLTPDLRARVGSMMRANPRLKVVSGLRDKYTQSKLKKKGIGSFGPGSSSPHSGGWAADLGPSSEYGWLQRNAHKFGLETASKYGEPWHVQRSGTTTPARKGGLGDPSDYADPGKLLLSILGPALGGAAQLATGGLNSIASGLWSVLNMGGQSLNDVFMSMMGLTSDVAGSSPYPTYNPDILKGKGGIPTSAPGGGGVLGRMLGGGSGGVVVTPGGAVNINSIYTKYASGIPTRSKTADADTQQRIITALQAASSAGFSGEELITLVSLAGRESGFRPNAYNGNLATGDNSYGLWQINTLNGMWEQMKGPLGLSNKEELKDPFVNARAAKFLYDQSSTPFYAWGPYRGDKPLHGGAEEWVAPVYGVAQQAGYVGDPGMGYEPRSSGGGTTIKFYNQFHMGGSVASSGSIDVSRMVLVLADRLEEEMTRRLTRNR